MALVSSCFFRKERRKRMFSNSWSMANRLLAIQYTPRAAGRVKQIHRENRGMMIMVIRAD